MCVALIGNHDSRCHQWPTQNLFKNIFCMTKPIMKSNLNTTYDMFDFNKIFSLVL